jgi:hypothetical protein
VKIFLIYFLQSGECCSAMRGFFDKPEILFILACKGFYIYAILPGGTFNAAMHNNGLRSDRARLLPVCGSAAFCLAGTICVIVTRFSDSQDGSPRRALWRLDTRHGSCVDGLVLAVESCITGRSQYKRTNTVRQIIEMKGIT